MSQSPASQPRIALAANRGITGTLFAAAIIAYGIRTYIRLRVLKRFLADDFLLSFAVICLIAVTALAYTGMQNEYDLLAVILHGADPALLVGLLDRIPQTSMEENAISTLWWFVIVPVKLAFLFFFRRLLYRVPDLKIWWYIVVVFTILAGLTCIAVSWLTCPYFTVVGVISCSGSGATYRVLRDTGITTAMDITSDILLVSIPITLLWRVRIRLEQKIGLGISLCLSLMMAVTAITRMAGVKLEGGAVDLVWLSFWQQQECSIAVIMVSVSAFRYFFGKKSTNPSPAGCQPGSKLRRIRFYGKLGAPNHFENITEHKLPDIPSATLTGMRTVIERAGSTVTDRGLEEDELSEYSVEP
ncbi:hypothetical protein MMC25_000723 [Agyrium rufum]|nr:hypothetical protein [Agyrium rufum]